MSISKIIAVVGATGDQGSGVVDAVLKNTSYAVRALTTDSTSDKAKVVAEKNKDAAAAGRFTIVQANLGDVDSLKAALAGVSVVYGMTAPSPVEIRQGKNLVDAAKAAGVEHLIWSSLPSIAKLSGGKYSRVFFAESKAVVEQYARDHLQHVTALLPGSFWRNLAFPWYTTRKPDGTVRFALMPKHADPAVGWTDSKVDFGVFVAAILNKPLSLTSGKTYPVMTVGGNSSAELAARYAAKTGEAAAWEPLEVDEFKAMMSKVPFGEVMEGAALDLFNFIDSTPANTTCFGMFSRDEDPSLELDVKASTLEEWLDRSGWKA
ncbi:hypothetical protein Rhopal_003203-T1 [Rhodotorula paludigena]|uniref:NmrA-like domain-containing protein n=1 Tax=Rhodotorula paludigena TaxID=86838 RepID=A0AAV5GIC0_9BASI|nr:hypothetical protein Rhopal_003203-T1 [Rhodotorula paludigena]